MKPSETTVGQRWLSNFDDHDVPTATLLADSLRFVTLDALRDGLYSKLVNLAAGTAFELPAVVLPERSRAHMPENPVSYENFHPGKEMAVTGGSENFVGMVLRELPGIRRPGSNRDAGWLPPGAELEELREQNCRSIVVVTDTIGSGNQVLSFIDVLARNKTLRSWHSYRKIKFYVVAFGASPEGLKRVRESRYVTEAWVVETTPTFEEAPWGKDERQAVIELCETKCRLNPRSALGYQGSAGLFVTARGAPNNLPAILFQEVGGWMPLFREKTVEPGFAPSVGDYRPADSISELADRVGQERLGRSERLNSMRATSTSLLQALILLNHGRRTAETLYAELGVGVDKGDALLAFLKEMEFVDTEGQITPAGYAEIVANKRGLRRTTAGISGSEDSYYPLSLR